jgi:hypothetical protein
MWTDWWAAKANAAQKLRDQQVFDPTTSPGSDLVQALANKHKTPPPWAKNTNHSRSAPANVYSDFLDAPATARGLSAFVPISVPAAATPPGSWNAVSKNPYLWQAFGTDDGTPTGRTAWVTDANGDTVATGTGTAPPNGSSYTWGFQFTGLTIYQTVNVNVQWTYSSGQPTTQSVTCVVAGTS